MSRDPIIDEIHAIRAEIAGRHNFDLKSLVRDLQAKQRTSGRPVRPVPDRSVSAVSSDEPSPETTSSSAG